MNSTSQLASAMNPAYSQGIASQSASSVLSNPKEVKLRECAAAYSRLSERAVQIRERLGMAMDRLRGPLPVAGINGPPGSAPISGNLLGELTDTSSALSNTLDAIERHLESLEGIV